MSNRVITISREFGSGGRTIGKLVAEKLGIPYYDAELIEKIAQQTGYTSDYVRLDGEGASDSWLSNIFTSRAFGPTNHDKMWEIQSKIILVEPLELRNVLQSFLSYSNQHALIEIYTSLS